MARNLRAAAGFSVALASGAAAQEVELRNDSLPPQQAQVAIQLGFVDGEVGAATFVVPPELYPVRIKRVQIMWLSARGGSTNSIQDAILIFNGGRSGLVHVFESDPVQLTDGFLNEFDFSNANIVINTPSPNREITIGLRMDDAPNGDPLKASLVTDVNGCLVGRNAVQAIGFPCNCWIDPCTFFIPPIRGDFVIRAIVERDAACYADCDGSTGQGALDIFDFLCFQNRYTSQDPYACNCDTSTGPGACDIFDFVCFQNEYAAGCP